ncbi:ACD protein, partial [Penelope pileata]|nr:ACD protein [Penelope pileata]
MQLRLSSLVCRIIVLQKYTLCFQEEARLEDCEFYLTAQRFIVLPMERQRLDSPNGNHEPSVAEKIKELWMRMISLRSAPSSESSLSQLLEVIAQDQLAVLKENAEECLDLQVPKATPAAETDKLPVTYWEAELKKEPSEDVFLVPANILVIPAEEGVVVCDASQSVVSGASPEKSSCETTVPDYQSILSQARSAESTAWSESSDTSLDDPWNGLPAMSLTLTSSESASPCSPPAQEAQQEVAADSNTPDLLEPCSHDSPQGSLQADSVHTSSPSLLTSYGNTSPVKADTTQATSTAEAACTAPRATRAPQVVEDSQASVSSLSPVFPVLPSSHVVSHAKEAPH